MFQTQYPAPPPQYYPPDYNNNNNTSPDSAGARYQYYSPRQYVFTSSPTPKAQTHTRRATQDYTTHPTYTTPKKSTYYAATTDYPSPPTAGYTATAHRRSDYVSDSERREQANARHHHQYYQQYNHHPHHQVPAAAAAAAAVNGEGSKRQRYSSSKHYSTARSPYVYDEVDGEYEYLPRYEKYPAHQPPPPYEGRQSQYYHEYREARRADHVRYGQVPVYTAAPDHHYASRTQARPRRASYTAKHTYNPSSRPQQQQQPPPPRPSTANKASPRKATEEDARRHGVPAGYSYKNWDPSEEPILLLGSVFDANSLGKWIYDWTVFYYGPATPMSEIAGELWLLLIQLAGKVKSAEDALDDVRQQHNRELVDDFLESGERLWQRFNKLLKICENYMWRAAKRERGGDGKNVTMGKTSGCEFVDAIFGRDRELERTEKLMTGIRLWSLRFTANIDPILANPAA